MITRILWDFASRESVSHAWCTFWTWFSPDDWSALGSMLSGFGVLISGGSLLAVVLQNRHVRRQADAAQAQLTLAERPFVAIHSEFCEEISANLVYAHSQGNGAALDVEASLSYQGAGKDAYLIGCMPVDGKYQFLIGENSMNLIGVLLHYKSISGQEWTTKVLLPHGKSLKTEFAKGRIWEDYDFSKDVTLIDN
jgi:hypothetical protein